MALNIIDHYKIIEILGEGGMGVVYKALDLKLERFIALKILSNHALSNPQFIERFKREARNQAKLTHPNIVPVYGFTEENRTFGIVMEYVEGETLEHLIERKGRLTVIEAVSILKQILAGIGYAHSKGFVHRDIKPSNIIINKEGTAKIMDFGISKSINEDRGITKTGVKIGTLLYMSPEQIKAYEPTIQSDIYSIGLTFYEMINGKSPFDQGTDYEIMEAHLKKNPPKLSSLYSEIPGSIDKIVSKALYKSTAKRYQNAEEFLADLQKIQLDSLTGKTRKSKERRKWNIGLLILTFTTIFVFASLFTYVYKNVSKMWEGNSNKTEDTLIMKDSYKSNPYYKVRSSWKSAETPTNMRLTALYFLDKSRGFACGDSGTVIKTTDGGIIWSSVTDSAVTENLHDIIFIDDSTGFIAGEHGTLIKTEDGGENWEKLKIGEESFLKIYHKAGDDKIFLSGAKGAMYRSRDDGENWDKIETGTDKILYDIHFVNRNTGFASGWGGTLIKTSNGGDNWEKLDKITDTYLRGVRFVDENTGFTGGGGGELYRSSDGGESWEKLKSGIISGIYKIFFFNKNEGIVLGSKGEILMTNDGGKKWESISSGTYSSLTDLFVLGNKQIIISGSNGTIIYSQL